MLNEGGRLNQRPGGAEKGFGADPGLTSVSFNNQQRSIAVLHSIDCCNLWTGLTKISSARISTELQVGAVCSSQESSDLGTDLFCAALRRISLLADHQEDTGVKLQ